MSGPSVSRRSFLAGSGAAAVALVAGVGFPVPPSAAAVAAPSAGGVADLPKGGTWGYSLDGDEWRTGFGSMDEAIDQSLCEDLEWGSVEVGYCVPDPIRYPGESHGTVAEWLAEPWGSLGEMLRDDFSRSNEDIDWEGGFDDAVSRADASPMHRPAALAVAASLLRLGRPEAAAAVLAFEPGDRRDRPPIETDDAVLAAVADDGTLGRELAAVTRSWVAGTDIPHSGRTLSVLRRSSVPVEYDEEADEYRVAGPAEPDGEPAPLAA